MQNNKKPLSKTALNFIMVFSAVFLVVGFIAITNFDGTKYFLGSLLNWGTGGISTENPNHYAYGENVGWIDFSPTGGNVQLQDDQLLGYSYSENTGWISLNCANDNNNCAVNYKVASDGHGNLSGYAYGENVGWINFGPTYGGTDYGVKIDSDGNFSGYAWGENVGWISFNCTNTNSCAANGGVDYKVVTDGQYYTQVATTITVQTQPQPPPTGCYQAMFATQPAVLVKDQYGINMPDGTNVTASISGGTGSLMGTLTVGTVNGVATFAGLRYSKPAEPFTIAFTSGAYSVNSEAIEALTTSCGGGTGYVPTPTTTTETEVETPTETETTEPGQTMTSPEIVSYVEDKINAVKFNIPDNLTAPSGAVPQSSPVRIATITILQKMLDALRSLLNFVK